jgi:hypothetical protein
MPVVNVGVTDFEFPENVVRVLLTGYGVSLAVTESIFCRPHYRIVSPPPGTPRTHHGSLSPR